MNHNQIKSIVYNLIKKYETRNPVRLAKELDIIIQIGDLKKISGCYLKIHERDFIYINETLSDFSDRVSLPCIHKKLPVADSLCFT